MRWILIYAVAAGALLCGQEKQSESAPPVVRIVEVKNANTNELFHTLQDLGVAVNITRAGNNILLSGRPAFVQAVEDTIHKLDVPAAPKKDIEMVGYLVLASRAAGDSAASYPSELERAVNQFKSLLAYKSFRLLDTVLVRAHEGAGINTGGFTSISPGGKTAKYEFHVSRTEVEGSNVHLYGLFLNFAGASIGTDVDIQPNQKVAVGKASVDPNGDALILVISAKVVD